MNISVVEIICVFAFHFNASIFALWILNMHILDAFLGLMSSDFRINSVLIKLIKLATNCYKYEHAPCKIPLNK